MSSGGRNGTNVLTSWGTQEVNKASGRVTGERRAAPCTTSGEMEVEGRNALGGSHKWKMTCVAGMSG